MLDPVSAAIKHVIILSDGQSRPGDYQSLVTEMVNSGIQLERIPELESRTVRQGITPERIRKPVGHICYLLALAAMLGGLLLRRV